MSTPRMQWVKFYELMHGEAFFDLPWLFYKTGPFTGRAYLDERLIFVMPWARVRSARPFGKAKPALLPLELQTCAGEGPTVSVSVSNPRGEDEKCPPQR